MGQEGSRGGAGSLYHFLGAQTQGEADGDAAPLGPGGTGTRLGPKRVSAQGQAPPGPSGAPWQAQGLPSRGHAESAPRFSGGERQREGKRVGGAGSTLSSGAHGLSSLQGDQDDRSYKQCRTSSPSSTGSVSLGRCTPTSRSPQHYSRPGTWRPRLPCPRMKLCLSLSLF